VTIYQYYYYYIFNSTIDFQFKKLNSRFNNETMKLFIHNSALEPNDNFKSFKVDVICKLTEKFYPKDFNKQKIYYLIFKLEHYQIDVIHRKSF